MRPTLKTALFLLAVGLTHVGAPANSSSAPNLNYRWVWVMTNLFRHEEVTRISDLIRRAAKVGYNGIALADTKLQSQEPAPDFYVKNLNEVLSVAKANHIAVIPCVLSYGYSNSMLARNPNLVEGMPVKEAPFVAGESFAQLEGLGANLLANGGMESVNGDKIVGFAYQDGPGWGTFSDDKVFHSGARSLRVDNPATMKETNGNARLVAEEKVGPWRQYHASAWVKTRGFDRPNNVRIAVLDPKGKSLCFQDVAVQKDQDWTEVHVTFNSQENTAVKVYFGIWDGGAGTLWWDDAKVEEVGLLNVIRRAGCPLVVKSETGTVYEEGKDFEPVSDPKAGNQPWAGEWQVFHESPAIKLTSSSRIKNGERLRVSYFAATSTGAGQNNICLSDPKTDDLAKQEIDRVENLFHPEGFFLSYDEIRVMNWCDDCTKRGLTPGQMLAASLRKSAALVEKAHPRATVFLWSDMFDKFHNAHNDYYLVNGDLSGSWKGLSDSMVVVNWNSGAAKDSLSFFSNLGCSQILAGYYDGTPDSIKDWLTEAKGVDGIVGAMYTTWVGNYSALEAFAKAAWNSSISRPNPLRTLYGPR